MVQRLSPTPSSVLIQPNHRIQLSVLLRSVHLFYLKLILCLAIIESNEKRNTVCATRSVRQLVFFVKLLDSSSSSWGIYNCLFRFILQAIADLKRLHSAFIWVIQVCERRWACWRVRAIEIIFNVVLPTVIVACGESDELVRNCVCDSLRIN